MGKFVARPVRVNAWYIVPDQVDLLPDWLKEGLVKRREKGKNSHRCVFRRVKRKSIRWRRELDYSIRG